MGEAIVYHVMHMEKCVAQVSTAGECKIYLEDFMPYDLVLEESDDFDDRINNVTNFLLLVCIPYANAGSYLRERDSE